MSYRVLIVDDSAITRRMIKRAIEMCGLEQLSFLEAGNGQEALDTLKDNWIDIVFADINMPEVDGAELVKRMAQDNLLDKTPLIIVSSERNEERRKSLEELGIRGYIKKPFRPEDFKNAFDAIFA